MWIKLEYVDKITDLLLTIENLPKLNVVSNIPRHVWELNSQIYW